jgi:hypothetical protein
MFIKDGKTLFGNSGLFFSLLILLVLLYFSYNKCYMNTYYNSEIENFYDVTTPEITSSTDKTDKLPIPDNVRILIEGGTVTLNFTMSNIIGMETPSKFIIVLAQYDSNKKNTGNNKFYLSNEYEMTSTVAVDTKTYQTNVCSLVDGEPKCQYKFSNLEIRDATGNLFYYKIGISAVYNKYNTPFIMPYNVNTKDTLFTIDSSTEMQNKQFTDFLKYQEALDKNKSIPNNYKSTMSTADGKYELIKSQLGNYPNNLLLEEQNINESSLGDLVDKTMAQGIINLNVKM